MPRAFARFSGAWANGAWSGISPVALVVEKVLADGCVDVVYGFAACEQFGFEARWTRMAGKVVDGRLELDEPAGFATVFDLAEGRLVGKFTAPEGFRAWAWLDYVPGRSSALIAKTLSLPRRPPWKEMRIPVQSVLGPTAGRTLQLQAFHYPTSLPGPQPLVVLNHGSTDSERPGVPSVYPFEPEARFFLARGCNVLALMRKGRGHSEGPVSEEMGGTDMEQEQVDSGIEDLHAAVVFMRAQPHVDPCRVIVAGQSRGGLLSMAYAGRYPRQVAGVLNFVGGWWSESWDRNGFNRRQAQLAGSGSAAPMLWLYGDRDSYYGLPLVRGMFEDFQAAGGRGALITFDDLPGDGHMLLGWQDKWGAAVTDFLDGVGGDPAVSRSGARSRCRYVAVLGRNGSCSDSSTDTSPFNCTQHFAFANIRHADANICHADELIY